MNIRHTKIMAADGFLDDDAEFNDGFDDMEDDSTISNIQDQIDDISDQLDDVEQDDVSIDMDNNIVNHLIAECENCKGIFISAMIASDQDVDSINGICPLCNKDTVQNLKWIIKDYPE